MKGKRENILYIKDSQSGRNEERERGGRRRWRRGTDGWMDEGTCGGLEDGDAADGD